MFCATAKAVSGKRISEAMSADRRSPEAAAYRKLYNTRQWRETRSAQLTREPLCRACLARDIITPATVCNHLDKAAKATTEGFFAGPFSSLCTRCHDAGEQKAESAGFSGEADASGWPTDPRHPANQIRGMAR